MTVVYYLVIDDWPTLATRYLVVDVLALRRPAGLQDVVVVAVVDDEDAAWPDHAGDVVQGQLLVTLVACGHHGAERWVK